MTNLRAKASEIREQGVAERGNFNPSGVPLRIYNFWDSHSKKGPRYTGRGENFCHFWRVVAIWAPLMFLKVKGSQFLFSKTGGITLGVIVVVCLVLGSVLSHGFLKFMGVLGIGFLIVAAIAAIVVGIALLHEKFWQKRWNRFAEKATLVFLGILVVAAVLAMLAAGIAELGWILLAYIAAGLVAGALFIGALVFISDYVSGIRAAKREAEAERISKMSLDDYLAERNKTREPGRISKFFSGVGDFIVFVAQIVRVKKWKICPLVTIENKSDAQGNY